MAGLGAAGFVGTAAAAAPAAATGSKEAHWNTIEEFCFDCHNTDDWAGSVAFDTMTADSIPDEAKVWEIAIKKVKGGLMPPPGKDQPSKEAAAQLVTWLETTLDRAQAKPYAGYVPLRRLNRREYPMPSATWSVSTSIQPATCHRTS